MQTSRLRRWRKPLVISLIVHVLLALAFWLSPSMQVNDPDGWTGNPLPDNGVEDGIMDILEPEDIVVPGIVTLAPMPATAAPVPTVDPPPALAKTGDAPGRQDVTPQRVEPNSQPNGVSASSPSPLSSPGQAGLKGGPIFPVPDAAKSVVYVIDRSGSMGERGRLALARRELEASLHRLPESAQFQVIAYNRQAEPLRLGGKTGLVSATPDNVRLAIRLLDGLEPEGGTEHLPALQQAIRLRPDVIFFLTDADDLNPADVRVLTQLNAGRSAIHVVELTLENRDRLEMPMHQLASGNHGGYRAVDVER
jgi:hypothetical protein